MIESAEDFHHSLTLLTEGGNRLRVQVQQLKETHGEEEIERLTDPQVSFLIGIHEEVTAYLHVNRSELGALEIPVIASELRAEALKNIS